MIKFNLKKLLEQKEISLTQLHSQTGISRNSLSLLANGKSQGVQFDTLEKIINALDVGIEDLFELTFNYLSIEIIESEILNQNKLKEFRRPERPLDEHNRDKFKQFMLKTMKCQFNIDGEITTYYIPYRIVISFNPTPNFRIEVDLKDYDINGQFKYLFNNLYFSDLLFDYYVCDKIVEFEKDFLFEMAENYNVFLGNLILYNDMTSVNIGHVISLTKKFKVNRQDINYSIKNLSEISLYACFYNSKLEFKNKNFNPSK